MPQSKVICRDGDMKQHTTAENQIIAGSFILAEKPEKGF
jgi:hypothetical protein